MKLTRDQLFEILYGTSYNMDGSIVKETETVRNYRVEVVDDKVHIKTFSTPYQILVDSEWRDISEVVAEEDLSVVYETFREPHLDSEIILDTDDSSTISVRSRDRVRNLPDVLTREGIELPREFSWVDGASDISGVIILPQDDYDRVFIATDPEDDGEPEIIFIDPKTEDGQERPYYVKEEGKTYIYVNHFSGGGGSQSSPYLIETEDELYEIRNNRSAYYLQTKDIVLTKWQTGAGWSPIPAFSGGYDGGGYLIKGLFINSNSTNIGLFGELAGGVLKRIRLSDVSITGAGSYVGTLLGRLTSGVILNCNVISGTVVGSGNYYGGFVGYVVGGVIQRCYNHADVTTSGDYCGGFVGYSKDATVTECYSTGKRRDGSVAQNSSYHGGFCGYNSNTSTGYNFYNIEKQDGVASGYLATAKTTAEMKQSLGGYSYLNHWYLGDYTINSGYPEDRKFIKYKKGKGSDSDPYLIYTLEDFRQIRHFPNASFRMENDIIMDSTENWLPIGKGMYNSDSAYWWNHTFSGKLDGNGKAIGGLYMHRRTETYSGIFGYMYGNSEIKDLRLIDFDLELGNNSGVLVGYAYGNSTSAPAVISGVTVEEFSNFVFDVYGSSGIGQGTGGILGYSYYYVEIKKCHFNVPVTMRSSCNFGGIVGAINYKTKISQCTTEGYVNDVAGSYVGGLIGTNERLSSSSDTVIEDCVSNMEASAANYSGGIIGRLYAYRNAYGTAMGNNLGLHGVSISRVVVTGDYDYGMEGYYEQSYANSNYGLPYNYGAQGWTISSCFYNRDKTPTANQNSNLPSLTARYTSEIRHESYYTQYDFDTLWVFDTGDRDGDPALIIHLRPKLPILGFRNALGLYYTDESGNILRYLEYGTLVAGSTSDAYPIWLQNNADFPVSSMKVWVDPPTVKPGITVELSLSNNPFVPTNEIPFLGTIPIGDARQFYVRFSSEVTVTEGGTFDMKAKASPV